MSTSNDRVELKPNDIEWLALIRYQVLSAARQARRPPPLNAIAINTAQDAVESGLSLVASISKVAVGRRPEFTKLVDEVTAATSSNRLAGFRSDLDSLNVARVNLKHHGNRSDSGTVNRHVATAEAFLELLIADALGVGLSEISLLGLIRNDAVRAHVQSAEAHWAGGRPPEAFDDLAHAFDRLLYDHEQRQESHSRRRRRPSRPPFAPSRHSTATAGRDMEALIKWVENLDEWVENLDEMVRIQAMGLDVREYAHLKAHTPTVHRVLSGDRVLTRRGDAAGQSDETFRRCEKFVIDAALSFATAESDPSAPWGAGD